MKNYTLRIVLVTLLMTLTRYGVAKPIPEETRVAMASMTVTELESAGDTARAQKDYAMAMRYFGAALRKDKNNSLLYNKLGLTELQNNNLRAARSDFEKAAKRDPKSAVPVNNIGSVEYMNKNYSSATKYFKKAIALDETRAVFHVNLGACWFNLDKLDHALAEYTRALELDPDALNQSSRSGVTAQVTTMEEQARYAYMMAKIFARRGDLENALRYLRKAKEEGYRNLASVYKEEDFTKMWQDPKLHELVTPPVPK
jgi:tetratricopeptide (TPR) repeat protein